MTDDEKLIESIKEGIVRRIDAGQDQHIWLAMAMLDNGPLTQRAVSRAMFDELRCRVRAGQTITALHLRGIGVRVDRYIPDRAVLRKCVSLGAPAFRLLFFPWDSN